jgi:TfoX/Sxy family transcriptional regulator of competence genes
MPGAGGTAGGAGHGPGGAARPMPEFHKADAGLADRFRATMADYPDAPVRMTFGSPCAYVNGNMAVGLHGGGWFVRLDPVGTAELVAGGGEPFSPMPGRPMTGYTLLPSSVVDDERRLRGWIDRSLAFVGTLPPKESAKKR